LLLGCHFLSTVENATGVLRSKEIAQSSVLVAAKMREKDLDCPTVSVVVKSSRTSTSCIDIKAAEVSLNNKFQWNFAFRTPYDFLDLLVTVGLLLASDTIAVPSLSTSPMSDYRGNHVSGDYPGEVQSNRNEQPEGNGPSQNCLDNAIGSQKPNMATPSTSHGFLSILTLDQDQQGELRRKIRKTCQEAMEYLACTVLCNPFDHKTMAYGVVVFSRKVHRIVDYE
jgi:hypothetical protein